MSIIRNEFHKISNRIIELCYAEGITSIVIGYNKYQKNGMNIGKKKNRNYHDIPHAQFYEMLKNKVASYGIQVFTQEESYTSKLNCLYDEVWKYAYKVSRPTEASGLRGLRINGKRITSLYKSIDNKIFHSDINGALNILQKFFGKFIKVPLKALVSPIRIKDDFKFLSELTKIFSGQIN